MDGFEPSRRGLGEPMTELFIENWTSQRAEKYQERQDRWLLGEVVRHARIVRDERAIAKRERLLAEMNARKPPISIDVFRRARDNKRSA
jgi:hypothetical protein